MRSAGIKASQWIDRTTTSNRENRSDFDVRQDASDNTGMATSGIILVSEWQIEECAHDEAIPLVVQ